MKQYREQNQAVFKSIQDFQRGTKEALPEAAVPASSTEMKTRQSHQTVCKSRKCSKSSKKYSLTLFILAFPSASTPEARAVAPEPTPALVPASSNDDDLEYEDDEEEYDEEYEDNNLNTKASVPETIPEAKKGKPASIMHTTMKPTATASQPKSFSQTTPTQKQSASTTADKFRLTQTQNGVVNHVKAPEDATTTEKVPEGFAGKIESAKPTPEPRKYHTRFLPSKHLQEMQKENPDSYVTVTKSVTGSIDETQTPPVDTKHFGSTYYTKSSTCGYFTFSCNIVYGSNGRSKICRPKAPNSKC